MPLPSIKKLVADMVQKKILIKHGVGKGTNYTIEHVREMEKDMVFKLTDKTRKKEIRFSNPDSMIEIKKLILTPLFHWKVPGDWGSKLISQNLSFKISGRTASSSVVELPGYSITGMINPNFFNPILILPKPIKMPDWERQMTFNDYPLIVTIEVFTSTDHFDFEIDFVFDGVLD
jgi:hypothetical protein